MKTLTKTFGLSLFFAAFMIVGTPGEAQADCISNDCGKKSLPMDSTGIDPDCTAENNEFDFDFENPFFFNDRIVINVYNLQDELIFSKAFSKEEADKDVALKDVLKQSEFLLSIDNQYYYYTKSDALVRK